MNRRRQYQTQSIIPKPKEKKDHSILLRQELLTKGSGLGDLEMDMESKSGLMELDMKVKIN
jgi:hypothetical protein